MPKRTRKEKERTQARRKVISNISIKQNVMPQTATYSLQKPLETIQTPRPTYSLIPEESLSEIRHDILKSVLFAAAAICFEYTLFVLRKF